MAGTDDMLGRTTMIVTRRTALKGMAALAAAPWCAPARAAEARLTAGVSRQQLVPPEYPDTEVWGFNGAVPGPELRFRQGETARIVVANRLPQATTVHWHGLRVPNRMDGVPHLTQDPIAPGAEFIYEFPLPDAGTYWYHPHERSHEQVARGLYGALVVEEREPIRVEREITWVLSDWKLNRDASQREDFDSLFDVSHGGRLGNTVTINGRFTLKDGVLAVRAGERIRLRLVNAAVARSFMLNFNGHEPCVIALDGQPVEPHVPDKKVVYLAPGMRADVVLDCMLPPGSSVAVTDEHNPGSQVPLMTLAYGAGPPLRESPLDAPVALAPNPLADPDVARAERLPVVFEGGAMGALHEAVLDGERLPLSRLAREHGIAWAINGVAARGHVHEPLFTLKRGGHYVVELKNETRWPHPIHLHGHAFRVISRYGRPTRHREWRDTVQLEPREHAEIAFVADNPGDWMFHCHILAHQAGGMMAMVRVA